MLAATWPGMARRDQDQLLDFFGRAPEAHELATSLLHGRRWKTMSNQSCIHSKGHLHNRLSKFEKRRKDSIAITRSTPAKHMVLGRQVFRALRERVVSGYELHSL